MRYAIVSDIHANYQAWQATWADIVSQGVDSVVCLGDVVGYGPKPAETLSAAFSRFDHYVIGNHEAALCGRFDDSCFEDEAREMITWTGERLGDKAIDLFASLPVYVDLSGDAASAIGVHGTMFEPEEYGYVLDEDDARQCFDACDAQIIFIGHSHEPALHILTEDGRYKQFEMTDFVAEPECRYIVNVGSVGLPRTDDFRASYVTFDSDTACIYWNLTAYDVDGFKADVQSCLGGSTHADSFLELYDAKDACSDSQVIDFSKTQAIPSVKIEEKAKKMRANRPAVKYAKAKKPAAPPKKAGIPLPIIIFAGFIVAAVVISMLASRSTKTPKAVTYSSVPQVVEPVAVEPVAGIDVSQDFKAAQEFWETNPDRQMAALINFEKIAEKAKGTEYEKQISDAISQINESMKKTAPVQTKVTEAKVPGTTVTLLATDAKLTGKKIRIIPQSGAIGSWSEMSSRASWTANIPEDGTYQVELNYLQGRAGARLEIKVQKETISFNVPRKTKYGTAKTGTMNLKSGPATILIVPKKIVRRGSLMQLKYIKLIKISG